MNRASATAEGSAPEDSPSVRMTVTFPNPDSARRLLTFLGQSLTDTSFSIECVTETDSPRCVVAVDDLTNRQLSTLTVAVERGYYDDPKGARLSDIAAEFDCSESAISQRLSAAERKLVKALVEFRQ